MATPTLSDLAERTKELHLDYCHFEVDGDLRTKAEEDTIRRLREMTAELMIGVKTLLSGRAKSAKP